jgi:hypothetical protein
MKTSRELRVVNEVVTPTQQLHVRLSFCKAFGDLVYCCRYKFCYAREYLNIFGSGAWAVGYQGGHAFGSSHAWSSYHVPCRCYIIFYVVACYGFQPLRMRLCIHNNL